jgi:DNA-binding MarR family transcriptional regulator
MTKLTHSETLKGLANAAEAFNEYGDMTTAQIRVFLLVARMSKVTGTDIVKRLGISKANAARTLTILSDETLMRRKADTLGLITYESDPFDKRYRYAVLTEKGKQFASQLTRAFSNLSN